MILVGIILGSLIGIICRGSVIAVRQLRFDATRTVHLSHHKAGHWELTPPPGGFR